MAKTYQTEEDGYKERRELLKSMDDVKLSKFHIKTWLVSGMGFFTDAYDLFIIGMVIALIKGPWHLTTTEIGLLGSTSLIAAVVGSLIFGKLLDIYGRKAIYGIELIIMIVGALLSALSMNVMQLMVWRFVIGIGIGGDYAASSILMSEYSNKKDRGKLVGMVFSMQSLGLLAGPLIVMGLLSSGISTAIVWRLLLGIGIIPPLFVVYYRRNIEETPRFQMGVKGDLAAAKKTINKIIPSKSQEKTNSIIDPESVKIKASRWILFTNKRFLALTIGTALTWFLMDWAFYGNSISSSIIFSKITPGASLYTTAFDTFIIFAIFAFPGYWIATYYIDRIGRKAIQASGFAVMAFSYIIIAYIPAVMSNISYFIGIYGISYFFIEFGPNVTTFVYPSEVFPVHIRGTGDGIAAAGGKMGAFVGTILFPILVGVLDIKGIFALLALLSALGVVVTLALLPETKGKSLEDASMEDELTVVVTKFSQQLTELTEYAMSSTQKLQEMVGSEKKTAYVKEIRSIEHNADTVVHKIHIDINKGIVSHDTRADLSYLASKIDDIIDETEAVAVRFDIFNYPKIDKTIVDLVDVIVKSVIEINSGVKMLDRLLEKDYKSLEKVCIDVNTYENIADELLRSGLKELFSKEHDPKRIMIYKEIYEKLEDVTDRCEDVTDLFKDLIVKYS